MSPRARLVAAGCAVGFAAFAAYGSLVPFDFDLNGHIARAAFFAVPPLSSASKTDLAANVVLFVPLGFCLCAAVQGRARGIAQALISFATVIVLASAFALGIEWLQLFLPSRVSSLLDALAQSIGAAAGAFLWMIGGPAALVAADRLQRDQPAAAPFLIALTGYAALLAVVQWSPFDFTLRPAELLEKVRDGRISLDVLPALTASGVAGLAQTLALYGPLGWLAASTSVRWRPVRADLWRPIITGFTAAAVLEAGQVLVVSRFARLSDVFVASAAVALGVFAARALDPRQFSHADRAQDRRTDWVVLAVCVWAVLLLIQAWQPFVLTFDPTFVLPRISGLWGIPLRSYWTAPPFAALTDASAKLLMSMPLGGLLAPLTVSWRRRARIAATVSAATAIYGLAEIGQLFMPARYPDSTDILLGIVGSLCGVLIAGYFVQPRQR